ncbi:MAG: hypothetical protein HY791_23140 [Deltaproteobacteria bacterium]|nr:hypothetical protein [Deltaproteobacteria bacterium]
MNPELRSNLYLPVRALLAPNVAGLVYRSLLLKHWRGDHKGDDGQVPSSAAFFEDSITDALLYELLPKVEELSGCKLIPTYTYARLYFYGNTLEAHRDREACEISASINLGCSGGDPSIWFEPNNRVEMNPGDGAIYLGREAEHWRPEFQGEIMGQVFAHFVIADGQFASFAYDKKRYLFPPLVWDGI